MAFKMNPSSPLLRKAMGCASPAKKMNTDYGSKKASSPAKQRTGGLDGEDLGRNLSEPLRVRGEGMGMKKELKRVKKKKPSIIEADPIKKSDPKENLARAKDPKSKGNTKAITAAEKLRIARKKMQDAKDRKKAARLLNRAERKNIKADKNERQMERKQKRRAAKNSPAKQTAKQKANLPKKVVDAIAAKQGKSPAKLDPMTIMTAVNMAKNLKKKK